MKKAMWWAAVAVMAVVGCANAPVEQKIKDFQAQIEQYEKTFSEELVTIRQNAGLTAEQQTEAVSELEDKIAAQIKEHSVHRLYRGIVIGRVNLPALSNDEIFDGVIESTIGRHPQNRKKMAMNVPNGKDAVTHYRVLSHLTDPENGREFTYMEFRLETGRTHQIRVHMAGIGHPLLGDYVYATSPTMRNINNQYIEKYTLVGQTLHAMTIGFTHPRSGKYMEFSADLPEYFKELLEILTFSG